MEINYKEFIENTKKGLINPFLGQLIRILETYVDEKDVVLFYPKNIYTGLSVEPYVFRKNDLLIFSTNDGINIKSLKYRSIKKVELNHSNKSQTNITMEVEFLTGDVIILNSLTDSDPDYWHSTSEKIVTAFKLLLAIE